MLDNTIKVIFLDIDGVLNSYKTTKRTSNGYTFVSLSKVKMLKEIITATDAKVVLSSDWRCNRDDRRYNQDFLELRLELRKYGITFYDYTPELISAHRGEEINQWLIEHPEVKSFVILDDRTDIEPNTDHWVQTTMSMGLVQEDVSKAISILNK